MRISEESAKKAVAIIVGAYGEGAGIWLCGSRANNEKRGGDVDFFIETPSTDLMTRLRCKSALADLFDLKVDLVVGDGTKPIHRIAKQTGVRLK